MKLPVFSRERPAVVVSARVSDARVLAAIHAHGFERGWDVHEIERLLSDTNVAGHVARPGGRGDAIGFVLSRLVADEAEILTICVAPAARGKGLARTILLAHLGYLAGKGIRDVFLEVAEDNIPALKLYRRFGYAEVGKRVGYYRRAGGAPATALVMRRALR